MVENENLHLTISVLFGIIWIISGLILNLFQFLCYIFIRPISKSAFRKINYYLTYSSWSQAVALSQYWTCCTTTVYFADEEAEKHIGKEHSIVLMNHKYEVDWLFAWMLSDYLHILGSAKGFAKKSIRWLPVIGWGWIFCEMIFVARSWNTDMLTLGQSLDNLMEYTDTITLLLFAEGTRFTKQKYENSVKYCEENGLHVLEHHLYPRTRGFVYTIQRIRDTLPALYNIQVAFPKDSNPPTLTSILKGKPIHGHLFIERLPVSKIPKGSDQEISNYLLDVFKKKDELTNYFLAHGKFPGKPVMLPRRKSPLIHLLFWTISVTALLLYFTYSLLLNERYISLSIILLGILGGFVSFLFLIRSTKANKGSSYGAKPSPTSSNGHSSSVTSSSSDNSNLTRKRIVTESSHTS